MDDGSFRVRARHVGGALVVRPDGELDIASVDRVRDALAQRRADEDVVLDLRGLRFVDTSGLQLLVEAHRQARAGGYGLTITRGVDGVQRVFEMAGLDRVLPFAPAAGRAPGR